MATMDLKAFCKKFKAYEKRVSARVAWSELLGEVGNATKNATTRAFENQKSPFNESWKPLSPATLRRKKGSLKLVESGHLKRSIQSHSDLRQKSVSVGTNLEYAAIHQFGGRAGRGHKVNIPARAFLPVNAKGELAGQLKARIDKILEGFLKL